MTKLLKMFNDDNLTHVFFQKVETFTVILGYNEQLETGQICLL